MLALLRDYLHPKDPAFSPFLGTTKENDAMRLSGDVPPGKPGFEEGRWITTEDIIVKRRMGLDEEGVQQAQEVSKIFEWLGEVVRQVASLATLASLLCEANQLDAAKEAALRAIDLLPEKGEEL